jgi:PilZ domain-containing protein
VISSIQRRSGPRDQLCCLIRVRPSDPSPAAIERMAATENVSSHGIYFVTEGYTFQKRTQLLVGFAQTLDRSAAPSVFQAEVVRLDSLRRGRYGVAAILLENIRFRLRQGLIVPETGFWKQWPPVAPGHINLYA